MLGVYLHQSDRETLAAGSTREYSEGIEYSHIALALRLVKQSIDNRANTFIIYIFHTIRAARARDTRPRATRCGPESCWPPGQPAPAARRPGASSGAADQTRADRAPDRPLWAARQHSPDRLAPAAWWGVTQALEPLEHLTRVTATTRDQRLTPSLASSRTGAVHR